MAILGIYMSRAGHCWSTSTWIDLRLAVATSLSSWSAARDPRSWAIKHPGWARFVKLYSILSSWSLMKFLITLHLVTMDIHGPRNPQRSCHERGWTENTSRLYATLPCNVKRQRYFELTLLQTDTWVEWPQGVFCLCFDSDCKTQKY